MDERKRRNYLIAIGVAVALVGGLLAIWPPPGFRSEDASGAIGAVQKHRAPQINSEDVLLADQSVVNQAKIVFGDSLQDAAKIQGIGASLGSVSLENRGTTLQAAAAMLESHQTDLQQRFELNAREALSAMEALMSRGGELNAANLENVQADLAAMQSLAATANLEAKGMVEFSNRLNHAVSELQSMNLLSRNSGLAAQQQLEAAMALENRGGNLNSAAVLEAAEQLGHVADSLNQKEFLNASLADRSGHLGAMALESQSLESARADLNAAMSLENAVQFNAKLAHAADLLGKAATNLESRAIENLQSRLAAREELGAALKAMDASLASRNTNLGKSGQLESNALASFNQALNNVDVALANVDTSLQSHMVQSMSVELGAVGAHLDAMQALQAQMLESRGGNLGKAAELESRGGNLGKAANLESKGGDLAAASALAARGGNLESRGGNLAAQADLASKLFSRDSILGLQSFLGKSAEMLQANQNLAHHAELASRNTSLQNRAGELASRNTELQSRNANSQ